MHSPPRNSWRRPSPMMAILPGHSSYTTPLFSVPLFKLSRKAVFCRLIGSMRFASVGARNVGSSSPKRVATASQSATLCSSSQANLRVHGRRPQWIMPSGLWDLGGGDMLSLPCGILQVRHAAPLGQHTFVLGCLVPFRASPKQVDSCPQREWC